VDYVMVCRTCERVRHLGKGWPLVGWQDPENIGWEDLADDIRLGDVEPVFAVLARLLGFFGVHNDHRLAVLTWEAARDEGVLDAWAEG
jgi:hypothetical protein